MFSGRPGGVSTGPLAELNIGAAVGDDPAAVAENRRLLAVESGLTADRLVWMQQTHSTHVRRVDGSKLSIPDTDGLVTTEPGLGLAVGTADCLPILAADPVAGVVAAVHAGRLGAAGGIALRMVETMVEAGARTDRIRVVIGPSICGACYEVPEQMQAEVAKSLPHSESRTSEGTTGLHLAAGVSTQLALAGVAGVEIDDRCTAEDPGLFSHRRDAPTGRQAGVIWWDGVPS